MNQIHEVKLSIVLLNFNRLEETKYTIEKLIGMVGGKREYEIIAVDNNSKDGTAEYLQSKIEIRSVLLDTNHGIAGYNEGFAIAQGEYILVLDDDSCPKQLSALEKITSVLDANNNIGILACHIETPSGAPQWKWHMPQEFHFAVSPFFIGCGFAIRRDLFKRIGWYPGEFFIYQNEIDVSFKVRQQGYNIYYHPDCRVIHRGIPSQRPGWRCVYYPTRNTIWIILKYYPRLLASYMIFSRILIGFGRAVYLWQMKAFFNAIRDAFSSPVEKQLLNADIRSISKGFFKQNSIIHQVLKKT
jgi:GT2 family glycosyltransferase